MQESEQTVGLGARSAALVFNSVVLVALVIGLARTAFMPALCAKVRITALDRVGVINKEKLEEEFPRLAVNPRHTLAMWIVEDALDPEQA